MRIATWNVNGLRAINKKGGLAAAVEALGPLDVLCLQEIRCSDADARRGLAVVSGALPHAHWATCTKQRADGRGVNTGYSGTAILSREAPARVDAGFEGCPAEFEGEGRVLTARFGAAAGRDCLAVVSVYVPNSGSGRHAERTQLWDAAFAAYLARLGAECGRVVVGGDFNVAHGDADVYNPGAPHLQVTAGTTPEERANFGALLLRGAGLRDAFREVHPRARDRFSWWNYRTSARGRNHGWRIDYWLVSSGVELRACDTAYDVLGSDHAPVWCVVA